MCFKDGVCSDINVKLKIEMPKTFFQRHTRTEKAQFLSLYG